MKIRIAAAFALIAASSLHAQTPATAPSIDLSTATPVDGTWTYSSTPAGSEATFANTSSQPQISVRCTRATRLVTMSKPATAAAPFLSVWTSTLTRNIRASFDPATGRLSANLTANDSLLDGIAFSRGRVGFSIAGQAPLVVPAWAEAARVIEDCRV